MADKPKTDEFQEAEALLKQHGLAQGSYLIRTSLSTAAKHSFALSLAHNGKVWSNRS